MEAIILDDSVTAIDENGWYWRKTRYGWVIVDPALPFGEVIGINSHPTHKQGNITLRAGINLT